MKTKNSNPPADLPSISTNPARAEELGPDVSRNNGTRYFAALLYTPTTPFALACCRLARIPLQDDSRQAGDEDFFLALRQADKEHFDIRDILLAATIMRGDTEHHGRTQFGYRLRVLLELDVYRRQLRARRSRVPA